MLKVLVWRIFFILEYSAFVICFDVICFDDVKNVPEKNPSKPVSTAHFLLKEGCHL